VISTTSLPTVTVGRSWSATLAAKGGTGPYRWRVSAGSVPRGFVLQTSGAFNGRATSTTPAAFTIAVTDAAGQTTSAQFRVAPVAIVGDINLDGQVNTTDKDILLGQYNQNGADLTGDLNHDGVVNITDMSILLAHWNGGPE
jgi:hypothetical protein